MRPLTSFVGPAGGVDHRGTRAVARFRQQCVLGTDRIRGLRQQRSNCPAPHEAFGSRNPDRDWQGVPFARVIMEYTIDNWLASRVALRRSMPPLALLPGPSSRPLLRIILLAACTDANSTKAVDPVLVGVLAAADANTVSPDRTPSTTPPTHSASLQWVET